MIKRSFFERIKPLLYLLPFMSILALMFLCQYIKRPVPFISHLGRYSIIVLGTHLFFIGTGNRVAGMVLQTPEDSFLWFLITLAVVLVLEYPVIYMLRRFVPRLTAQEPFFYERWRLRATK